MKPGSQDVAAGTAEALRQLADDIAAGVVRVSGFETGEEDRYGLVMPSGRTLTLRIVRIAPETPTRPDTARLEEALRLLRRVNREGVEADGRTADLTIRWDIYNFLSRVSVTRPA